MMWLLLFVLTAVCDVAWTKYFIETERRAPVKAGLWSALIAGLGRFTVTQYMSDRSLISAVVLGAFAGTWATIFSNSGVRLSRAPFSRSLVAQPLRPEANRVGKSS